MITPNQKGFVQGKKILDVVISTHLIIHSMEHSKNPGMAFQIDISNTYDRLSWPFLFVVLKKYGIDGRFLKMIFVCVTSPMYYVSLKVFLKDSSPMVVVSGRVTLFLPTRLLLLLKS